MVPVKIEHFQDNQFMVSTLRHELEKIFQVVDLREIVITKANLRHYKHIAGIKVGKTVSVMNGRRYRSRDDFEFIFTKRLSAALQVLETTEGDFIVDELSQMEQFLDMVIRYDLEENPHKAILRRYIDFLKNKPSQSGPVDDYDFFKSRIKYPEKDKLINLIKNYCSGAKPQEITTLFLALEELDYIEQTVSRYPTKTHNAINIILGSEKNILSAITKQVQNSGSPKMKALKKAMKDKLRVDLPLIKN